MILCHMTMHTFNCILVYAWHASASTWIHRTSNPAMASGEDHLVSPQDYMDLLILGKGEKYPYTIPSFPVVTAMLREVKVSFGAREDDDYVSFYGYMRECSLLDHPLPAVA